ncbi:hypothetical protein BDM02DRAFT_3110140 [Thelephora ganbajun]|uniref:Uncharacterized protein n=1 Tax=Thelephora ganbajun TaxID=370292 RepID=A0ACB6ZQ41_THEGA|nr:hypothetical protein BDM02DRAFT_3110140 [Thelephora ganbajun]
MADGFTNLGAQPSQLIPLVLATVLQGFLMATERAYRRSDMCPRSYSSYSLPENVTRAGLRSAIVAKFSQLLRIGSVARLKVVTRPGRPFDPTKPARSRLYF